MIRRGGIGSKLLDIAATSYYARAPPLVMGGSKRRHSLYSQKIIRGLTTAEAGELYSRVGATPAQRIIDAGLPGDSSCRISEAAFFDVTALDPPSNAHEEKPTDEYVAHRQSMMTRYFSRIALNMGEESCTPSKVTELDIHKSRQIRRPVGSMRIGAHRYK